MKKIDEQELQVITSLRHKMHVERDFSEYQELARDLIEEFSRIQEEFGIKSPSISQIDWVEEDEDQTEVEAEYEWLWDNKDENNNIIEDYLSAIDEKFGLDSCPSGEARAAYFADFS
jgi:YesN/AraC family two-component response regulator